MQFPNRTNRTLLSSRGHIPNAVRISEELIASVSWIEDLCLIGGSIILKSSFEAVAPIDVPYRRTTFPTPNLNQLAYA
ncbi:hypothetical protein PY092_07495 [Muricauda sp. 334s03]|uniref:Uncharacterized protein n=1 Tax=Flagellimonas yonaguniensis TaxID=3031325 RepID=A0ABT5XY22_9FLAO|nr:hypothetical protein [[Muricauda] yonaguniensis]MDF0715986.1 hypothetical protein [[Muricauda] yonaguniensis]